MPIKKTHKTELLEKLNELLKKQSLFQQEINDLQLEITQLKAKDEAAPPGIQKKREEEVPLYGYKVQTEQSVVSDPKKPKHIPRKQKEPMILEELWKKTGIGSELEQFIGTNLINKIGMIVVIIGVGIGAKYAIDNDLISPLVRIILGYALGGLFTFFAFRLKKQFFNFSAVLISGAMTIYYYITYAAFSYYQMYSSTLAFILMVLFTVITVFLALYYNRQIIAHYGLVGAYLVPFLLKDPDSSVLVLLSYMVVINVGILFISTKKQWKPLNYLAFLATWVIFISWFSSKAYNNELAISLSYASAFFVIFYLVFLSYKLVLKEKLKLDDIFFLLLNAGIFYLIGTIALIMSEISDIYSGLCALINASIHGFTAYIIYRSETKSKTLFYWALGIFTVFITIAVGVQFDQYISSLLWSLELALLFWIGRRKKIQLLDYLSFSLLCVVFISLLANQASIMYNFFMDNIQNTYTPIINMAFLTALIGIASFSFIYFFDKKTSTGESNTQKWSNFFTIIFSIFFVILLYFSVFTQINLFWNNIQLYASYELGDNGFWVKAYDNLNTDIFRFKGIWQLNYTLLFLSVMAFTNRKWIKNYNFNAFIFLVSGITILIFMLSGLDALGSLRKSYMTSDLPENFDVTVFHLLIRYVAYLFFALLFYSLYRFVLPIFAKSRFYNLFEVSLSIIIIWIFSSELIHWLSLYGTNEIYKHGLSIMWGILSFMLVGYGIWKKKKHLRITAIILFAGTILKLFFYDLTNLETVPKTIVFLSIGVLLLIVSFMYNKYRDLLFGND